MAAPRSALAGHVTEAHGVASFGDGRLARSGRWPPLFGGMPPGAVMYTYICRTIVLFCEANVRCVKVTVPVF